MTHQITAKRRKISTNISYHDAVPFDDDYSVVHSCEPKLRRINKGTIRTTLAERSAQQSTAAWLQTSSWITMDDPEFALDPDGDWYDEIVAGDIVMDHAPPPTEKPEASKKKSKVSVSLNIILKFNLILMYFRDGHMLCGKNCIAICIWMKNAAGRVEGILFQQKSVPIAKHVDCLQLNLLSTDA